MRNLSKQYRILCKTAEEYKKGIIHERQFVNQIGSFVMLKLNASITPYIHNFENELERVCLNGK